MDESQREEYFRQLLEAKSAWMDEIYERAKEVFAVVKTLETRPWGCFILQKGVVFD